MERIIELLQNYTKHRDIRAGRHLHAILLTNNLDIHSADYLIRFFTHCGTLFESNLVFCTKPKPNIYTWHAIASAHISCGEHRTVLALYNSMQQEYIRTNQYMLSCASKACSGVGDVFNGQIVHYDAIGEGYESNVVVCSALIQMYASSGWLDEASKVFWNMPQKDVVSWSVLLEAFLQNGNQFDALKIVEEILKEGIEVDKVTFLSALKACSALGSKMLGNILYYWIIKNGYDGDIMMTNTLVDMYAKCAALNEAQNVFNRLHNPSIVSWGAMVSACVSCGQSLLVLEILERMHNKDVQPNEVVFLNALKACHGIGKCVEYGMIVHHQVIESYTEVYDIINCALIDMYAKNCKIEEAQNVFDGLNNRNAVIWGAIISGYALNGQGAFAYQFFHKMQEEGVRPGAVTYLCVLSGVISNVLQGMDIHNQIVEDGLESNEAIGNALVDMYAKCGSIRDAHMVFKKLQNPSMVSWSTLMGGYIDNENGPTALQLFAEMQHKEIEPDNVTYLCALRACSDVGALLQGKLVHNQIVSDGHDYMEVMNALIDMYAQCWCVEDARGVFDGMDTRDIVAWGSMISAYAQDGNCRLAEACLEAMQQQGLKPNAVIFTSLLSTCCQAGEVEKGQFYFKAIYDHNIVPSVEHITCMVNLLGGSGHLEEAERVLRIDSNQNSIAAMLSLLTACKVYGNVQIGRQCFDILTSLKPDMGAAYALMIDIYVAANLLEMANSIVEMGRKARAERLPGRACIEIQEGVFEFIVGERPSLSSLFHLGSCVLAKLRREGYVPLSDLTS